MDRVTRLAHFVASDPQNLPLACDFVDAVIADGRWDEPLPVLEALRAAHGGQLDFLRRIARLDLLSGHHDLARASYRALLALDPADAVARHDLAFLELSAGDAQAAEQLLSEGQGAFSGTPELAVLWARVAYLQRKPAEALTRLRLMDDGAERPSALALESLMRWDEGENAAAIELAQRALQLNPRETDAVLVAASAALVERDGRQALAFISPLLASQPRHGRALSVFGQALLLVGDMAGAREALTRAVQFMPDHIGTWHVLAWVHLLAGEVGEAHAAYEAAYAIDRNFGETHGGLGLVHVLRGENEEAQAAIRRAQRLDPNSATAMFARYLLDAGASGASSAGLIAAMRGLPELAGMEPGAVLQGLRTLMTQGGRS